jgi:hypothetical protein
VTNLWLQATTRPNNALSVQVRICRRGRIVGYPETIHGTGAIRGAACCHLYVTGEKPFMVEQCTAQVDGAA